MKYTKLFPLSVILLAVMSVASFAQQPAPPADGPPDDQAGEGRPNLLAELGLSPDQVMQIRRINQERRPRMVQARRLLGDAQRNLDMAIYADVVSDAEVQARLKEFQIAESELARLRFESELSIRKVLTADQLVRFRELRQRFAEQRRRNLNDRRKERRGDRVPEMQEGPFRRRVN